MSAVDALAPQNADYDVVNVGCGIIRAGASVTNQPDFPGK
ncbi:MAG: hypothetical protein JW395_1088 [Nitrospira sp.]|nr:hypothetical protein [Nitrospira sp.]